MKIDIISGFLGAGKTSLIKHVLKTRIAKEKVVIIENEFGAVSVDSAFLEETNVQIRELSQGCICCSLVGDFSSALKDLIATYSPDRIIIEPSGVGKLSDIEFAVKEAGYLEYLNAVICVVDASKAKLYARNFGEFFFDQISSAHTIFFTRMDVASDDKKKEAFSIVAELNPNAVYVTTSINELDEDSFIDAYEGRDDDFVEELMNSYENEEHHHHDDEECECHHHHHDHDEECECHHHHEHDEEEHECCHHHEHDEEEHECCHHHDHDEEEHECCHHHDHDEEEHECCHHHHHHHDADEVFTSVGIETVNKYNREDLTTILNDLSDGDYGDVVRAKGVLQDENGKWFQFNITPGEVIIEDSKASSIGKICVIGAHIDEAKIRELF